MQAAATRFFLTQVLVVHSISTTFYAPSTIFLSINGAIEACQEERRRPARAANTGFVSNLPAMIL
jgi:hypothetical protein